MKIPNYASMIKKSQKSNKQIIPPLDGWKPNMIYLVNITMRKGNPPWTAVLITGFNNENDPNGALFGGYSKFVSLGSNEMSTSEAQGIEYILTLGSFPKGLPNNSKLSF